MLTVLGVFMGQVTGRGRNYPLTRINAMFPQVVGWQRRKDSEKIAFGEFLTALE